MNLLTKAGLVFLIAGALSFLGLMFAVLLFGVGASANPPLTGWYVPLIRFIYTIGTFWFAYLIIGAVLIVAGLIKKHKS